MQNRPYYWQMIKEAVERLGGKTTYSDIKNYIKATYSDINENTVTSQIIICSVNHPSRVHYPENRKPRMADSQYDFLFTVGRGQVELYDPNEHGVWEIRKDDYGKLTVAQAGLDEVPVVTDEPFREEESAMFPLESHLRDFIARNIQSIRVNGRQLQLYRDNNGRDGVEYPTAVGPIDILAIDDAGAFVVFELKLSRGADHALGQLLRYMGWVKRHLAEGKPTTGIIVAKTVDEKLKYASSVTPDITLFEYELSFRINPVGID